MDSFKFVLFVAFCFIAFLIWQEWQKDYGPTPPPVAQVEKAPAAPVTPQAADVPETAPTPEVEATPPSRPAGELAATLQTGAKVTVQTDVLKAEIDTHGGDIRILDLLGYPVAKNEPDQPVRLFHDTLPNLLFSQSGLLANSGPAPNHHTPWRVAANRYQLQPGEAVLRVPFEWSDESGLRVTKIYSFQRGSYVIDLEQMLRNDSGKVWRGRQYEQLQRSGFVKDPENSFIRTYTGAVLYSDEEKYEKITFEEIAKDPLNRPIKGGWGAMIQHYFLAAWIPPENQENHYYTKELPDSRYVIGFYSPVASVEPGQEHTFSARLYAGPKLQDVLESVAPGLGLTVDYGALTIIANPIFWLLEKFHNVFGNWGWSIVCVTLVIKLLFFKLSEASYRSMAGMRKVQPQLQELREKFSDDKARLNQAMMELYRKEKINPLGGCLPILVQIPVFIALYWVLVESVELRQAPFVLWINDLSAKDPYFILPLLMGLTMFIQQRLNPAPMDPVQQKVLRLFPVIFTVFFAFFPAGLVLYWVVNNTLSIVQQWYITRKIEAS